MKKLLSLILSACLLVALLAGCGGGTAPTDPPAATNPPVTADTTPTEAPAPTEDGGEEPATDDPGDTIVYDGPAIDLTCNWTAPESSMAAFVNALTRVTEATDGKITFTHYFSNSLMTIPELAKGLRDGIADIADLSPHMYPTLFVYGSQVTSLPFFGGESSEQFGRMYDHLMETQPVMQEEYTKNGLKYLAVGGAMQGYQLNMATDKSLRLPEDFRGMRIIETNEVLSNMFVQVGAAPVNQPVTEYYSSLEKAVCDGLSQVPSVAKAFGCVPSLTPQIIYFGNEGLCSNVKNLVINLKRWESFTPELQAIFERELENFVEETAITQLDDQVEFYDVCAEGGVEFVYLSEDEIAAWKAIAEPIAEEHLAGLIAAGHADAQAIFDEGKAFLESYDKDVVMYAGRFANQAEWVENLRSLGWTAQGFTGSGDMY